jgi:hypothetical protein
MTHTGDRLLMPCVGFLRHPTSDIVGFCSISVAFVTIRKKYLKIVGNHLENG